MSDVAASEPLVPADADMRGLPFMPLDVVRLMDSDLFALSTGDEFKAAVAAWCKCWLQLPAGSLPNDDRILAHLTGAGNRWPKVKTMALRGFVLCSDGRLYHPVVCEKVLEAWQMRLRQRERSAAGNAKRWAKTSSGDPHGDAACDPHGDAERDRKGQGHYKDSEAYASGADAPSDPVKAIFDRGLIALGGDTPNHRSVLGKLRKQWGDAAVLAGITSTEQEMPSEPASYLVMACQRASQTGRNGNGKLSPATKLYAGFAAAASGDGGFDRPPTHALLDRR